jgi:hypothetical protein
MSGMKPRVQWIADDDLPAGPTHCSSGRSVRRAVPMFPAVFNGQFSGDRRLVESSAIVFTSAQNVEEAGNATAS